MTAELQLNWDPTGDGYPHPSEWLSALREKLQQRSADYRVAVEQRPSEDDASLQAAVAKMALIDVIRALQELPALRDKVLVEPLLEVVLALHDLGEGRVAQILKPVPALKGRDSARHTMLKISAAVAVRMLVGLQWTETASRKAVSAEFQSAGWSTVNHSTLRGWSNPQSSFYRRHAAHIEKDLAALKQKSDWPFSRAMAITWVRKIARSPHLM